MKKFLYIAALLTAITLLLSSMAASCQEIQLTVTKIKKSEDVSLIKARSGYKWYKAYCKNLPDSVKVGTKILAIPAILPDTCKCLFKRYK